MIHADKNQNHNKQIMVDSAVQAQAKGAATPSFVDARPATTAQRQLHVLMANSAAAVQLKTVQAMANRHSQQLAPPIQRRVNRTGLPDNLKAGMEAVSGMNLEHVKVHYNSAKPATVQAHAYAQGSEIHVASGQEQHLPHELGHVVQQMQGRVQPTTSVGGMQVNANPVLEQEADTLGDMALQMKVDNLGRLPQAEPASSNPSSSPIQRQLIGDHKKMASYSKYLRFFVAYDQSILTYNLAGDRLDAFVAFLDCVESYWNLAETTPDFAYAMFNVHLQMGVTTREGFAEAFADAGVEDHGYGMNSDPAEYDGSTAVIQQKRNPGPSGPKDYGSYTKMLFQKSNPNATIDFDAGLLNSSSKKNNKPGSLVDLSAMLTGGKVNPTFIDPHKSNQKVKCPRAGSTFDKADRDQHFAMADMLYYIYHGSKPNRTGTWTWHHLETPYQMVLVDMLVHAKHGHNGGVYIWP